MHHIFSLEEHHARDHGAYYHGLVFHPHHNYTEGWAKAHLTGWAEYFIRILAGVFTAVKEKALHRTGAGEGEQIEPEALRRLDPRGRAVLSIFAKTERITSADVVRTLGLSR